MKIVCLCGIEMKLLIGRGTGRCGVFSKNKSYYKCPNCKSRAKLLWSWKMYRKGKRCSMFPVSDNLDTRKGD